MKTTSLLSWALLSLALGTQPSVHSEIVDWNQLPRVVQRTINEQRGPVGIVSIERRDRFGAPVYDVRLNTSGQNSQFLVTETGTLVNVDETMSLPGSRILNDLRDIVAQEPQTREMSFGSLPIAVQNTIRTHVGDAPIQRIEMVSGNGQVSYLVPFRRGDEFLDLWVDPNGNVLVSSPARVLLSSPRTISLAELPLVVRDVLRTYAPGLPIESVRRGSVDGRTAYEVTLDRDGRRLDLRLSETGALLRDTVNDRFLAETGRLPSPRVASTQSVPARVPMTDRQAVSFNQLPSAVLETIRRQAGSDFIEKIEEGAAQGQRLYQAVIRHAGETIPLRIAETGSLIQDDVNQWGLARLGQDLSRGGQEDWRQAPSRATIADARRIVFDQLPLAVQNTLRYYAGGAPLHNLVEGTANGGSVYQADVSWRGDDYQLRIADDGSLVDDRANALFLTRFEQARRATGVGQAPAWQTERGTGSTFRR